MVLFIKFDDIQAELAAHDIDLLAYGLIRLRGAVATVGAADGQVGINGIAVEADVFYLVEQRQHLASRVAQHGKRRRAVGAGVHDDVHVDGGHYPVFINAGAKHYVLRMAGARAHEFFFARVFEPYGFFRFKRQRRADVFDEHFLLAAEPAAYARLYDAHPLYWDA